MHNLIYLSTASYLLSDEELIDILNISRANNSSLDVSGLLLYHEGSIMQILEGEKEVLQTLYKKINRDQRHKGVIKMVDAPIETRSFPDWSMGFKQISKEDWSTVEGYLNPAGKDELTRLSNSGSSHISTVIKSFASVNRTMMKV